jgi:tRNA(Ile)-lysidine synthase TilS/MesJ
MEVSRNYPRPGPVGGKLIRKVIGFLRTHGESLPIDSHILIACSGGLDSIALALLLNLLLTSPSPS